MREKPYETTDLFLAAYMTCMGCEVSEVKPSQKNPRFGVMVFKDKEASKVAESFKEGGKVIASHFVSAYMELRRMIRHSEDVQSEG